MRSFSSLVSLATLALIGAPALAADNGIYLGAALGKSGVSFDETIEGENLDFDADSTGFKAIVGWRFLDALAVEANYVDLGSGDDQAAGTRVDTDVSGLSLSAVGFVPIGPVDLYARVGVIDWQADLRAPGFGLSSSEDGTDLAWGGGAQFRLGSLALRAEYERYEISGPDSVDMVSVGVTWTFL